MRLTGSEWKLMLFCVIACGLTAVAVIRITGRNERKVAVVDAVRLFNEYKMKLELEAKADGRLRYLGRQMDSLKQEAAGRSKMPAVPKADLESLYRAAEDAEARLGEEYRQSNELINEQVWRRLNPQIDEYGRKHGLRLIIGANGMGSVLYHDDFYDHTNDLINYVNHRYEEGD